MRRLPPMNAIPAFEAAARLGSMTAAAREIGRSHSAVSKQVAHLEAWLGIPLFTRNASGLALTPDGATLFEAATRSLDGLERAVGDLAKHGTSGPVVLGTSAALAARWLLPRLFDLHATNPGVTIQLSIGSPRDANTPFVGVDMLLSWDRLSESVDDLTQRFGPGSRVDVVDDARMGPVMRDAATGFEALITVEGRGAGWRRWSQLAERTFPSLPERVVPNTPLAIEAAVSGLGMALVERRLVERELAAGTLVAPFGFLTAPDGFVTISPPNARREVRKVVHWLVRSAPFVDPERHRGTAA